MRNDFKIRIFQPIVQEYRVALHEGLAARYGDRIEIWAAERRGSEVSHPLTKMRHDYGHPLRRFGPVWWQSGLSIRGLTRGDVIVVCGDLHQLSSLWIALKAKCRGVRVVWWGHHMSALAKELNVRIRLMIARWLADVMLCYTEAGISFLTSRGFPKSRVFATGNTIDLNAVEEASRAWDGRRKFGDKKTLLFCGVLREKVRVDVLLCALRLLLKQRQDFHCAIIGSGDREQSWKDLAKELGVDCVVTWTGELRGQDSLAPWFLSSDLFVYPGRIGLSIIHAFSYGLPVILNDNKKNHGPEYVAFAPDMNGWSFTENNVDDLAVKIAEALDSPDLKARGMKGKQFVFEHYSMQNMVNNFSAAIEAAAQKE